METVRQYAKQLQQTEAGGYLKTLSTKVKQMALNLSDLEVKVEEATNNEPWGPHGSAMADITEAAFDPEGYRQIMGVIARRLQDTGELWRHVYKSMLLLEYMLKHGPQKVVQELSSGVLIIEKLSNFQYKDKNMKDYGENVRHRAKQLSELVLDPERVRAERKKAKELRSKYTGVSSESSRIGGAGTILGGTSHRKQYHDEDDDDDVYASSSTDRGAVGVAKDPKEATRARIEAMKQLSADDTAAPAPQTGKKLSTMRVDPKVSASLGLVAPQPKPAPTASKAASQGGEVDLMGSLDSPEAPTDTAEPDDSWSAFEDGRGTTKSATAATDDAGAQGDTSWASFESAPASDPVADLFALDAASGPPATVMQPSAMATPATDPFSLDTATLSQPQEVATVPKLASMGGTSKAALPEDIFSAPLTSQLSFQQQPQQQEHLAGAKLEGMPARNGDPDQSVSASFGQHTSGPAFGQSPEAFHQSDSCYADSTVHMKSISVSGQNSQGPATGPDPFAGLGF